MSHRGPWGRCRPRSSVVTLQPEGGITFSAGLPVSRATVRAGPPLSASCPSRGFATLTLSVAFLANEHPEVLPMRLYPPEFMSMAQSGPPGAVFRARIVDVSVTSENAPLIPPPAAAVVDACAATELRTTVEATVVSVLSATNAAPPNALAP